MVLSHYPIISGKRFLSTNWSPTEPNEMSKNCLKMALNHVASFWWADEDCNKKLPYICVTGKLSLLPILIKKIVIAYIWPIIQISRFPAAGSTK